MRRTAVMCIPMFCRGEGAGAVSASGRSPRVGDPPTSREDDEYSGDCRGREAVRGGAAAVVGPAAVVVTRCSERGWARPSDRGKSTVRGDANDDDGAFAPVRESERYRLGRPEDFLQ